MLCVKDISREDAEQFFLKDLELCKRALTDAELDNIMALSEYTPFDSSRFIGIIHDNILIGVIKYEEFTNITVNLHLYLLSFLHGKDVFKDIHQPVTEWFIKNTGYKKAVVLAPGCCSHVHGAAEIAGFKLEGKLEKAIEWRDKDEDIYVYALDLNTIRRKQ